MDTPASLTERLQLFMRGDTAAADALLREVMPRLRDIAIRESEARALRSAPLQN